MEAGGSLSRRNGGDGWEAALTKSSRASTARWCGLGEQDEKVYVRNQCLRPRYVEPTRNLADLGRSMVRASRVVGVASVSAPEVGLGQSAGKVCGVPAGAIGVKLDASLVDRETSEHGNRSRFFPSRIAAGGVAGRWPLPTDGLGWGGAAVVVAGVTTRYGVRESRTQGKGRQQVEQDGRGNARRCAGECRRAA